MMIVRCTSWKLNIPHHSLQDMPIFKTMPLELHHIINKRLTCLLSVQSIPRSHLMLNTQRLKTYDMFTKFPIKFVLRQGQLFVECLLRTLDLTDNAPVEYCIPDS